MLTRFNHVAIVVPDLEKAREKYAEVLGAEVSEKNDYPEISIPKKVDIKTMIAKIANHINHWDATFTKEPLSIPFQGIKV